MTHLTGLVVDRHGVFHVGDSGRAARPARLASGGLTRRLFVERTLGQWKHLVRYLDSRFPSKIDLEVDGMATIVTRSY